MSQAETLAAFHAALPDGGVLCGLDLGRKTIGVAFCDREWRFAGADVTIRRGKQANDLAALAERMASRDAKGFVLGMPLNLDGTGGPSAQRSRAFARTLEAAFDLPLLLWDESLTSVAAEEAMAEAGIPRAKWAEKIDAHAAAVILQDAIDRLACG